MRIPNNTKVPTRARRVTALLVLIASLACSTAHAQWSLDAGVEQFDWREHTTPIVVHEHGPRYFGSVGYMLPRERGALFAYRGTIYGGNPDYNGSFQFDDTKAASGASTYLGTTQRAEGRWRWPAIADGVLGLEYETWKRQLSTTQAETYRTVSLRVGVEHIASASSRIVAGGGMRFMLDASEDASIEAVGLTYQLALRPGRGSNPYLHAGVRIVPHLTLLGSWDGMNLGESNQVVLLKRGKPRAVVSQPSTDVTTLGVRLVYAW